MHYESKYSAMSRFISFLVLILQFGLANIRDLLSITSAKVIRDEIDMCFSEVAMMFNALTLRSVSNMTVVDFNELISLAINGIVL